MINNTLTREKAFEIGSMLCLEHGVAHIHLGRCSSMKLVGIIAGLIDEGRNTEAEILAELESMGVENDFEVVMMILKQYSGTDPMSNLWAKNGRGQFYLLFDFTPYSWENSSLRFDDGSMSASA